MASLPIETPMTAVDVARGVCRWFAREGAAALTEVSLGNGRRADVMALGADGRLTIVEIKVSMADLRADLKWPDYLDYCDRFFWAVPEAFPTAPFEAAERFPDRNGLIVADRFEAAVLRPAAWTTLHASRRKAETLRFARCAAARLMRAADPGHIPDAAIC
jgi:hypothetical protein